MGLPCHAFDPTEGGTCGRNSDRQRGEAMEACLAQGEERSDILDFDVDSDLIDDKLVM